MCVPIPISGWIWDVSGTTTLHAIASTPISVHSLVESVHTQTDPFLAVAAKSLYGERHQREECRTPFDDRPVEYSPGNHEYASNALVNAG